MRFLSVDQAEARVILKRWMSQVASMDPHDEIVLSSSGCNFTTEGATQLSQFTSLDLVSTIEFSGILGECTSLPDAMNAQMVLVESLMNDTSYCAVKLDNVADRDIAVLRAPHFVGKGNCDSL